MSQQTTKRFPPPTTQPTTHLTPPGLTRSGARKRHASIIAAILTSLGLFLLALLPRAYDLQRFVTADEAKWVYRSAQFLAAFLRGDFAATTVNLTPAVTTTWLGSLGLTIYYQLNRATIDLSFVDWLASLPEFRAELDVLAAVRWPMVIFTSLGVVAAYLLARRLFNPTLALIAAAFIALDPHTVALSRILGHDAPTAVFMSTSILSLLLAVPPVPFRIADCGLRNYSEIQDPQSAIEAPRSLAGHSVLPLFLILSGLAAGLAFLSKAPALFLIPFAGLLFVSQVWGNSAALYFWFKRLVLWAVVAYLTFIAFWPAAWVDPLGRPLVVVENAFLSATDQEEAGAEGYWLVPELGPFYYLVNGAFKLSPLVMIGAALGVAFIFKNLRGRENDMSKNDELSSTSAPHHLLAHAGLMGSSILWILTFALLFGLFMTFSDKRSPRYILPAFPALALVAAFGWLKLYQVASSKYQGAGNTSHISPPTDHGPRTTDHGPRTTDHEPRTTDHKPQTTDHKPQTTDHGPQTTDHKPRTTDHRPQTTDHKPCLIFSILLILSALAILLPYTPYYFTYFNPLLGGPYTAPHLVKIGWGEGLDRVGRFLQREFGDSRVGTAYGSTVAPFFKGDLSGVTGSGLDYVVLYSKQVQSGRPSPTFIRYFEQIGPIFSVDLNGIHYADLYPGPAVRPSLALTPGLDPPILPKPIGFRPLTPYGRIGQALEVDVLWLADDPLPTAPSTLTLEPISVFDFSHEGHDHGPTDNTPTGEQEVIVLAKGPGRLTRRAGELIVSRHRLMLPADLARGLYALLVDGRPLGEIELRHFQIPAEMGPANDFVFGEQIGLAAFQFTPTAGYIGVTIAWQAQKSRLPDYTVFVQLLEAETNERLAGIDTQPLKGDWPTSRWVKDEVVVDEYLVAVPPNLAPGFYKIIAGLYRPETSQRLTLPDGQDHWILPWVFIREE